MRSDNSELLKLAGNLLPTMTEPTAAQLRSLYRHSYQLTELFLQAIHMVRIDERTGNLFILVGREESIELEIDPEGELLP